MDLTLGYNKNLIMSVSNIFRNPDYVSQLRTIQTYKDLGYVTADIGTDKEYALRVVKGGAELAEIYGDDYYMNVLECPRITEDDVCASMFGVSAYSNNVGRAMEIITYLNTNQGLRNILQYGVKDVDYTLDDNGSVVRLNDSYMMDIVKTGNCYIAYPEEGLPRDYWEDAKVQSNETLIDPLLGFDINGRLAEYGYRLDKEQLDWVAQWGQKKLADIENCDNYDDLCAMVENLGGAMNSDMIEVLIINAKDEEQEAIINMGKLTNKAYDTATGADGEEDPNGESPYTIYYNWLVEFGYLAPEIAE
jgi:hypothetical protein